jgi:hypothetical protein
LARLPAFDELAAAGGPNITVAINLKL